MSYQHRWVSGESIELPAGKVVCIGRNYADHAKELNNEIPTEPLLFLKPSTSLSLLAEPILLPKSQGSVHFEVEMAVLIGKPLSGLCTPEQAEAAIAGLGVALDLTLRELQDRLKSKGHPWERSKAFDGACPLSEFVPYRSGDPEHALQNMELELKVNGATRQLGNSELMLTPVLPLLVYAAQYFTLLPGDVVITGTPAGVGPLLADDQVEVRLGSLLTANSYAV